MRNEVRVYNPKFSGSDKLGSVPPAITVTSSKIPARILLTDELASGEKFSYGESEEGPETAASVYIAAVLAVTSPRIQTAELLKEVGRVKGFVQQRIRNSGALAMLKSVAHRLAEQFGSELRFKEAA